MKINRTMVGILTLALLSVSCSRQQDEAFRAVSLHRLLTGEAIQNEEVTQQT